jgi:hypothetical protein
MRGRPRNTFSGTALRGQMKRPKKSTFEFSGERWSCPHCRYSVPPEMESSESKHFNAYSLRCVRCLYRTETKPTWGEAEAAYRTIVTSQERQT